jgi:hypothetical protein
MFELDKDYEAPSKPDSIPEIEDEDIVIEDVAPKKKEVPMFTKKGKMVLALIVIGGFAYYLWNKRNGNVSAQPTPTAPEPTETPKAETGGETIDVVEGSNSETV